VRAAIFPKAGNEFSARGTSHASVMKECYDREEKGIPHAGGKYTPWKSFYKAFKKIYKAC
jgi:hypothetical protein